MEWTPGITSKLASSGTMHIEVERFKTFDHRWPFNSSANLSPAAMAAAGLFFDPHPKTPDRAICFSCKNALSNWDVNDHPMEEHKRWYKSCAFVAGTSKNVPISNADRTKSAAAAPAPAAAPALSAAVPAAADKVARAGSASTGDALKPPPLNSYLQSLGAPVIGDAALDQATTAAALSDAEIVYSFSSAAPSPSKLLDDSFWSTPSLPATGSDGSSAIATASGSSKPALSQAAALKTAAVASKQDIFDDQDEGLVVQHNGRRLKKKPSARTTAIESSGADAAQTFQTAAAVIPKPSIMNGERSAHVDAPVKVPGQHRIFNLASACAETAAARADLDALRTSVKETLTVMQLQLPTFPLAQLDSSIVSPVMKGLARLERATANISHLQLGLSGRHAAQLSALKDVSMQVERRQLDLNVRLPLLSCNFMAPFCSIVLSSAVHDLFQSGIGTANSRSPRRCYQSSQV
jgi:hypothetical protein